MKGYRQHTIEILKNIEVKDCQITDIECPDCSMPLRRGTLYRREFFRGSLSSTLAFCSHCGWTGKFYRQEE